MMGPVTPLRTAMKVVEARAGQPGGEMIPARKTSARRSMVRLTTVATVVVALLAFASPAWAETFPVETTNDSGPSSLRQAIADANATSEPDTIVFGLNAGATITLASTLTITSPLRIQGPGALSLTISGNNAVRPFVVQGTTLNLSGVTVANGRAEDLSSSDWDRPNNYGGAIYNPGGILNIRDSILRSNYALLRGGAIYNSGLLSVEDSILRDNRGLLGGAIHNRIGLAIFFLGCVADITNTTLANNSANSAGGAVYNSSSCTTDITGGSRLDGNRGATAGGILNAGTLRVTDSAISGNYSDASGGGIASGSNGNLVVRRSTFSGNRVADYGGGIYAGSGSIEVGDSTFHGNSAHYGPGGGISIQGGNATITNSTLSANSGPSGGGIWINPEATTASTIRGNIVAGNTARAVIGNPNVEGNYTNGGFNIVGGTAAEAGLETDANGNPVLANNGGPTQTVALVRGSKAIDAGNSFGSAADQRGTPRPKDYASLDNAQGGDGSDIGAFEYVDPDASAPTVEASSSPQPDEGGLNNSDVSVAINASDEAGGSGVWRVSYSASGAQQVSEQNVPGNSAQLVISADGETVVTYWATDGAGNRSENRTLTVRLDKTPPDTTITLKPPATTKARTAKFSFTSELNATFECSLDGLAFEACSSPTSYSDLSEDRHTFEVRATDDANNKNPTPDSWAWTVDTTAPNVGVVTPPSGKEGVNRSTTLTATFSEKMNKDTISKETFKLFRINPDRTTTQITNVAVELSANGLKAKLDPFGTSTKLLQANTKYRAVVNAGARDLAGNRLDQDPNTEVKRKVWTFTTGSS